MNKITSSKTFFKPLAYFSARFQKQLFFLATPQNRVVTWYMGSGLKAQNMTGIRAQRKGLRAQKNGIRDHKAFKPESGIVDTVSALIISW